MDLSYKLKPGYGNITFGRTRTQDPGLKTTYLILGNAHLNLILSTLITIINSVVIT